MRKPQVGPPGGQGSQLYILPIATAKSFFSFSKNSTFFQIRVLPFFFYPLTLLSHSPSFINWLSSQLSIFLSTLQHPIVWLLSFVFDMPPVISSSPLLPNSHMALLLTLSPNNFLIMHPVDSSQKNPEVIFDHPFLTVPHN